MESRTRKEGLGEKCVKTANRAEKCAAKGFFKGGGGSLDTKI